MRSSSRIRAYPIQITDLWRSRSKTTFENDVRAFVHRITVGCSYAPEEMERYAPGVSAAKVAKILTEELGIREIRLGIRWNRVVRRGTFDFSYYDRIITTLLRRDARLCLNIGPIKTFRWPETHVSHEFASMLPKKGGVLGLDSELTKEALGYIEELIAYVKKQYPEITFFQPENECFHQFGVPRVIMDRRYVLAVLRMISDQVPNASFLLSSSENRDLPEIISVFNELPRKTHVYAGVNYYCKTPPRLTSSMLFPDSITRDSLGPRNYDFLNKWVEESAFHHSEVTELQMEPWGKILSPGSSVTQFRYALFRVARRIISENNAVVRIWGIERLVGDIVLNNAHTPQDEIRKTIQWVNCI